MVNEFVYCPRLFYLEWVQSRFSSNDDVEQGLYVHRVVDQPRGQMPEPEDPDTAWLGGRTYRSVWLTSQTLRVTAKIDVVEASGGGSIVPVDYEKGSAREWRTAVAERRGAVCASSSPPPRRRLCRSRRGDLVRIGRPAGRCTVDDEASRRTRAIVAQLWSVARQDVAPPPLVNSPKCPRCSLVGVCLSDEINAIRHRETQLARPRRIVPSHPILARSTCRSKDQSLGSVALDSTSARTP